MIKIRLLFFGRLRETLQTAEETVELPPAATAADALTLLRARGGVWQTELAAERALGLAINQEFCKPSAALTDGAELAIFPPVTGG